MNIAKIEKVVGIGKVNHDFPSADVSMMYPLKWVPVDSLLKDVVERQLQNHKYKSGYLGAWVDVDNIETGVIKDEDNGRR